MTLLAQTKRGNIGFMIMVRKYYEVRGYNISSNNIQRGKVRYIANKRDCQSLGIILRYGGGIKSYDKQQSQIFRRNYGIEVIVVSFNRQLKKLRMKKV